MLNLGNHGDGNSFFCFFNLLIGKCLIQSGHLCEKSVQGGFGNTVELTGQGSRWLQEAQNSKSSGGHSLKLVPSRDLLEEDKAGKSKRVTVTMK